MAEHFNAEVLAIVLYFVILFVCLGLISYVIWGWRKRMRHAARKLREFPK
jgi:flagellar biogenesis protein FliO